MPTILLTGFGPFPSARDNPSGQIARKLAAARRPAFAGTKRIAHVFTTTYAAIDEQLPVLILRHRPDAIVMFGLSARTKHVRIELKARNRLLTLFPDAAGFTPRRQSIRSAGPTSLRGRAPFARLLAAARSTGMAAALSCDAGSYVCNYCYWRAVDGTVLPERPRVIVFVHVPKARSSARPTSRSGQRPPGLAHLVKAGEAVLAAVIAGLQPPRFVSAPRLDAALRPLSRSNCAPSDTSAA
ncbi:MAG: pyroglutamyl-peptidase I [Bradyrhizobiaceae bacterium]|nr:pyroglutamyl-peptidase I [Bradyrhizobiaceae bacterium]